MERYFKRTSTQEWFHDTFGGGSLSVPKDAHRQNVADRYGLDVADIEATDAAVDPRSGTFIELPTFPPPIDPDEELVAAISQATTVAELKAALLGQKSEGAVKGRPVK